MGKDDRGGSAGLTLERWTWRRRKILCMLEHGFATLLRVGETGGEGIRNGELRTQRIVDFHGVTPEMATKLWVANEPVWAIGVDGNLASVEYAEEKHQVTRGSSGTLWGGSGSFRPRKRRG